MAVKQAWGEAIREQREFKDPPMTQARLAELVGVDQSAVSFWESGRNAPSVEHQLAIARALGVAPPVLFTWPIEEAVA